MEAVCMIEKSEIQKIAKINHIAPYQQEKHYIQNIVLWSIAKQSANEIVFKGGTALWFFYGLNRFSEDLDFTVLDKINYAHMVREIENQFNYRNIPATFKEIKTIAGFSFRIGAEGPLFTEEKNRCFVRVEMSERKDLVLEPQTKTYVSPYNDLGPLTINVMDPKEIMAEKLRAVLLRDKVRDIYDLWFLLMKGMGVERALIEKKIKRKFIFDELIDKIEKSEQSWQPGLDWMIMGQVPSFMEVKKDIEEKIKQNFGFP
jgi:predicted nucleotidyltransferase component of viral defense system